MPDLSVLIPARHEPWLARTVRDVLDHSSDRTEAIVVLDGAWPTTPLPQHPRLTVVYQPVSIGQRAATNLAARLSTARYVMKLDAHCALPPGYDTALLDHAHPRTCYVPTQYNLHVFDWLCTACGARTYQGPRPAMCPCGSEDHRQAEVWRPRLSRKAERWRFDRDLHFQYWREGTPPTGVEIETMSLLGACWLLERDWFLGPLEGLDERHGSWGQMGTELACKVWLSGGRLVTTRRTWFAHLFRTQPGFGFPYPMTHEAQDAARRHSQALWRGNRWSGQVHDLAWLLDRFWPVPGWSEAERETVRWRAPSSTTPTA